MVNNLGQYVKLSGQDVLRILGTREDGLKSHEIEARHKKYGLNVTRRHSLNAWLILWRQIVGNPLTIILAAATTASYMLGQHISAYYIFAMIVLSIALGFWNEYAAEKTVRDLLKRVSLSAIVVRDGQKTSVPVSQITIGDVVLLAPGSIVPADMRLLETGNLEIDQAALTGESKTVYKTAEALTKLPESVGGYDNIGLMGTVVTSGWGRGVVVAIDNQTEFGRIAESASFIKPETEFQRGMRSFGDLILKVILVLSVAIFGINALLGHPIIDSMLFSLAIAVGLTPELLPIIVTISLSHGAGKLAKKHVISKQLISIENLGNMDILCTDKTGTLTEGKILVQEAVDGLGRPKGSLLKLSVICNSAILHHKYIGNAIDVALWEHAAAAGVTLPKTLRKMAEEPFSYDRQMMYTVVAVKTAAVASVVGAAAAGGVRGAGAAGAGTDQRVGAQMIVKGAPEAVLRHCVDGDGLAEAAARFRALGEQGLRVIALATRDLDGIAARTGARKYSWKDVRDLHFEGFITLQDKPKLSAEASLRQLENLSVAIKILTGDSDIVTRRICEEVGLPVTRVVTGAELGRLSGTKLQSALLEANVFARVTPEQKQQIIGGLQKLGHTVGYLGDGINDIPSLRGADVGISVNTAVDVAKEAAPIVLLRQGLDVIADGIIEGRRTFSNTIKYILMGTSSNFGNMFSAAGASFFLPFLPMSPTQILFTNALYDVSQATIPSDNVDEESLLKPRQWNIKFIKYYMMFFGPISSLYDFLTFGVMLFVFHANAALFQTGWFVESLATEVLVVFVIRTARVPFYRSRPGKWLTATCLGVVAAGVALTFTPLGATLGFVPLPPLYFLCLVGLVSTYLILVAFMKAMFLRRFSL